jgi:hypothetical protein
MKSSLEGLVLLVYRYNLGFLQLENAKTEGNINPHTLLRYGGDN